MVVVRRPGSGRGRGGGARMSRSRRERVPPQEPRRIGGVPVAVAVTFAFAVAVAVAGGSGGNRGPRRRQRGGCHLEPAAQPGLREPHPNRVVTGDHSVRPALALVARPPAVWRYLKARSTVGVGVESAAGAPLAAAAHREHARRAVVVETDGTPRLVSFRLHHDPLSLEIVVEARSARAALAIRAARTHPVRGGALSFARVVAGAGAVEELVAGPAAIAGPMNYVQGPVACRARFDVVGGEAGFGSFAAAADGFGEAAAGAALEHDAAASPAAAAIVRGPAPAPAVVLDNAAALAGSAPLAALNGICLSALRGGCC